MYGWGEGLGLKERVEATSGEEREPYINDRKWGAGSELVQNQDVGDEVMWLE